jgi:hypothetical protein
VKFILDADADDARDINAAITQYQRTVRWPDNKGGGVLLTDGTSNLVAAILGEICRDWLEYKARTAAKAAGREHGLELR